jgi:hypothetical protein
VGLLGLHAAMADHARGVHQMSPIRACTVSFTERGQRQTAHVDAETAYEACALALKFWSTRRFVKGPRRHASLEIEINAPARMLIRLRVQDVLDWLYVKPAKNEAEKSRKDRLRALLNDDRFGGRTIG